MNTIYDRLMNGESIDDIMNGFADEANAAQARIEEENKAAEAAREAQMKAFAEYRARDDAKRSDLTSLLDDTLRFVVKWYPELELEEGDWDDEDLKTLANLVLMLLDVEVIKTGAKSKKKNPETIIEKVLKPDGNGIMMRAVPADKPVSTDDVFANFFKSLGLD